MSWPSVLLASLAVNVAASTTASTTAFTTPTPAAEAHTVGNHGTVNVFLGAKRPGNYLFLGKVIGADDTATTYQVHCLSGALNLLGFPTTSCNTNDAVRYVFHVAFDFSRHKTYLLCLQPWTVTHGPSAMVGILSTAIGSVTALLDERCSLQSRTVAHCNYTFVGSSNGRQTMSTAYPTLIAGDKYYEYPITMTQAMQPSMTGQLLMEKTKTTTIERTGAAALRATKTSTAVQPTTSSLAGRQYGLSKYSLVKTLFTILVVILFFS